VSAIDAAALRAAVSSDLPLADRALREWSGLGQDLPPAEARIISRTAWVEANLVALRGAFDPLEAKLRGRRVPRRVLGAQFGAILGLLSTRVLGQYVVPLAPDGGAGQLILVGPNLIEVLERAGPAADDVRRSVVLHELTHRLQFEAVPWLGTHLRDLIARYIGGARFDLGGLVEVGGRIVEALRSSRQGTTMPALAEVVLTAEQREVVTEAQALMSLLEGHGNAAMEGAATGVVRDPGQVREVLRRRRSDVVAGQTRTLLWLKPTDYGRRLCGGGQLVPRPEVAALVRGPLRVACAKPRVRSAPGRFASRACVP